MLNIDDKAITSKNKERNKAKIKTMVVPEIEELKSNEVKDNIKVHVSGSDIPYSFSLRNSDGITTPTNQTTLKLPPNKIMKWMQIVLGIR